MRANFSARARLSRLSSIRASTRLRLVMSVMVPTMRTGRFAAAAAHPAIIAVLMAQPELPLDAGLTALHFQIFAAPGFQARPVVGMDQIENRRKVIGEFVVG